MNGWGKNGHFKFWWGCSGRQPGLCPYVRTPGIWADLPLRWVRPEHHVTLGLACLNSRPHVGTPSAWAALPRTHSQTPAPRGET